MDRRQTHPTLEGPSGPRPVPPSGEERDVVFDFTDLDRIDLGGLVLVLTARSLMDSEERTVWARSMSDQTWQLLGQLGIDDLFEPVPLQEPTSE